MKKVFFLLILILFSCQNEEAPDCNLTQLATLQRVNMGGGEVRSLSGENVASFNDPFCQDSLCSSLIIDLSHPTDYELKYELLLRNEQDQVVDTLSLEEKGTYHLEYCIIPTSGQAGPVSDGELILQATGEKARTISFHQQLHVTHYPSFELAPDQFFSIFMNAL